MQFGNSIAELHGFWQIEALEQFVFLELRGYFPHRSTSARLVQHSRSSRCGRFPHSRGNGNRAPVRAPH